MSELLSIVVLPVELEMLGRILIAVSDAEVRHGRAKPTTEHTAIEIRAGWGRCLVTYEQPVPDTAAAAPGRRTLTAVPPRVEPDPARPTPLTLARLRRPPEAT